MDTSSLANKLLTKGNLELKNLNICIKRQFQVSQGSWCLAVHRNSKRVEHKNQLEHSKFQGRKT